MGLAWSSALGWFDLSYFVDNMGWQSICFLDFSEVSVLLGVECQWDSGYDKVVFPISNVRPLQEGIGKHLLVAHFSDPVGRFSAVHSEQYCVPFGLMNTFNLHLFWLFTIRHIV